MNTFELFENLPDTVITEYLERLPKDELYHMCTSSKRLRDLCKKQGNIRKLLEKLSKKKEIDIFRKVDDDEEYIETKKVLATKAEWERLLKMVEDDESLKIIIFLKMEDWGDEYDQLMEISYNSIVITEEGSTTFGWALGENDEAREMAGFVL